VPNRTSLLSLTRVVAVIRLPDPIVPTRTSLRLWIRRGLRVGPLRVFLHARRIGRRLFVSLQQLDDFERRVLGETPSSYEIVVSPTEAGA
jgi:hypothetical protein